MGARLSVGLKRRSRFWGRSLTSKCHLGSLCVNVLLYSFSKIICFFNLLCSSYLLTQESLPGELTPSPLNGEASISYSSETDLIV